MTDLEMRHFTMLRARINQRLEELRTPHHREQIDRYTWLYGALGAVPSDAMFICENPSLRGVRQAHRQTVDGGPPDIEAQWWGGPTGPPATRFRPALYELGLKTSPPSSKGGWRCYITNVVKEANLAGDQAGKSSDQRIAQAVAWCDILAWEVAAVSPKHVFAVGCRAYQAILELQARSALPPFTAHRITHFSVHAPMDEAVKADICRAVRSVIQPAGGPARQPEQAPGRELSTHGGTDSTRHASPTPSLPRPRCETGPPRSANAGWSRSPSGRIPERQFKYQHVLDVILDAREGDTPSLLAKRVRERSPQGVYEPVRICEDINRILARQGRFNLANVTLTPEQRNHIIRLKDRMITDGAWQRR